MHRQFEKKAAIEISLSLNGFVIRDRRVKNLHEREKKVVAPSELFRSLFPRKCRETINAGFSRERNISRNIMKSTGAETRPSREHSAEIQADTISTVPYYILQGPQEIARAPPRKRRRSKNSKRNRSVIQNSWQVLRTRGTRRCYLIARYRRREYIMLPLQTDNGKITRDKTK